MNKLPLIGLFALLASSIADAVVVTWSEANPAAAIAWLNAVGPSPSNPAPLTFQSYQLNESGLTVLPNPFSTLEVLPANQYRVSITSLHYAPTSLTLFIGDFPTNLVAHSIVSAPQGAVFVGDPINPNSELTSFHWHEIFTTSQDLARAANEGRLFFSYHDDTNTQQTARFYSAIPEPSGFLLCAVALCASMGQRRRTKCEQFVRSHGQ